MFLALVLLVLLLPLLLRLPLLLLLLRSRLLTSALIAAGDEPEQVELYAKPLIRGCTAFWRHCQLKDLLRVRPLLSGQAPLAASLPPP